MCGQLTAYNTYATLSYTKPPFLGFSCYQNVKKEVNKDHEAIFSTLQKYVKLNLVVPVGEEHMYYAAIHHKACKLTTQGQHYWNLVKKNTI